MKIHKLEVENVKRVRVVEITPEGNLVIIGGENGEGKTSVLDSIMYALAGKGKLCELPLRKGEKKGRVQVELDELVVTRTFTDSGGGTLTVKGKDGRAYPSPQAMLDDLVGSLSFDPLEFMRQKPADQLNTLRELVGLDLSDLEAKDKKLREDRTIIGRDIKQLQGQLDGMAHHADAPAEETKLSDLLAEIERRKAHNESNAGKRKQIETVKDCLKNTQAKISELEAELANLRKVAANYREMLEEQSAEISGLVDADVSEIQAKIAQSEQINRKVRENLARKNVAARLADCQKEYDALTKAIDGVADEKAAKLSAIKFPIDGLGFGADGVTYNAVPLSQASAAEQLQVSVAMGLMMNKGLPVLLIRDGSLLDAKSLKLVAELAEIADAQVWMERVGDGQECQVIIEDGMVRETRQTVASA